MPQKFPPPASASPPGVLFGMHHFLYYSHLIRTQECAYAIILLPPYRRGYERLNVDTELQSGDIMSLVLKNPQDYLGRLGTEYGAKTYYPMVPQTDSGAAKFFSIVKFLVSLYCVCVCLCV